MRIRLPDGSVVRAEGIMEDIGHNLRSGRISLEGVRASLHAWFPSLASNRAWMRDRMAEAEEVKNSA